MSEILIGRQEILDSSQNIYAYELLFRGADFDPTHLDQASDATNQIITDTVLEMGLSNIVGNLPAFINFTRQNLLDRAPLKLPPGPVVIEVLESVAVDQEIIETLRELSQAGYTIALDDFELEAEWLPLLEIADIIKLDVLSKPIAETLAVIEQLKPYKLTLLAEKVETYEQFEQMKAAGCTLFQGYFFSKPKTVSGTRLGVNQAILLQLLMSINAPETDFETLREIVSRDVSLSLKLLKYINSAFFGLRNEVSSIGPAMTYLGMAEVKRWANILTLSAISDRPDAVFQQTLVRAKMCELLAVPYHQDPGKLFLIGMLSGLELLLDSPLAETLAQLPLEPDVHHAIIHHQGVPGKILAEVVRYERWELTQQSLAELRVNELNAIYLESINWARSIMAVE